MMLGEKPLKRVRTAYPWLLYRSMNRGVKNFDTYPSSGLPWRLGGENCRLEVLAADHFLGPR
jgi:hypothetical protein